MREARVTMTDLRQSLASLVNRAAYGGERIVLISHGEPKAALIGIAELRRLSQPSAGLIGQEDRYARALEAADLVRGRIRRWQRANRAEAEDSAETLRILRSG